MTAIPSSSKTFENGTEFIAFDFASDSEDDTTESRKGKGKEKSTSEREWDRDKPEPSDQGRKRKRREEDRDDERSSDRYNGRYQNEYAAYSHGLSVPWMHSVKWEDCTNVAELLHREVKAFAEWVSPSALEDEMRGLIVGLISTAVKKAFPDAEVKPFGSFETKLYLPLGDIDLVIFSESMAYSEKNSYLRALARTIQHARLTDKVTIISKARVPIVKFVTTGSYGRFKVDISVNQRSGVLGGQIVNGFLRDLNPAPSLALRALILLTKAFLLQRSLNEVYTGGLGSYSIVCLAVSFLQMHPKIRRGELDPDRNLGVILMEFFELYGVYFNYNNVGISVRHGGTYYNKRVRGWFDSGKPAGLSIEDPADPSNDIASGSFGFAKVRATFAGAHNILAATAFQRAAAIKAKSSGQYRDLGSGQDRWSILSSIVTITQETINHRRMIQEIYESGALHAVAGVATPLEQVDRGRKNQESSRRRKLYSAIDVEEVGSDMEASSEVEEVEPTQEHRDKSDDSDGDRYAIALPKKRRRTGTVADEHTVFITDSEDDDTDIEEIESQNAQKKSPSDRKPSSNRRSSSDRRDYWLSKGMGDIEAVDSA